jgi:short-subunit dehydrogenase
MSNSNYVLIGSSSALSREFVNLSAEKKFYTVSTKDFSSNSHLQVCDYINDIDLITSFISKINNPTVIFFNGFMAENRPKQYPTIEEINKTLKVNYFVPLFLTEEIDEKINVKKFVYMSSFAAIKPRNKNFIYGHSKRLLEETIASLNLKSYLFFRFGKINTNFSVGHNTSIFDLEVSKAARALAKHIDRKSGIIYPNFLTKLLSSLFYIIPLKAINKLGL